MNIRTEVSELASLGPLPGENADESVIARHQASIGKIDGPVSVEEAAILMGLFGSDDCYGLAWSLLHLIESAPGGAPLASPPTEAENEWLRRLWARSHR